jgi:pimeloyl-ACP methyl ester carboxylesterase
VEIPVKAAILFATPPLGKSLALAQTLQQALQAQKADALPLTSFYDTPVPLPPGRPGSLINSEPFEEYQVPPGVGAVQILYHSRSASGQDVASSGVVLVPFGTPPAGGWPVIAWAHGTSGIARICAPSLMKDVYYSWEDLFEFPLLGYAVVATDYTGLGTNFPHQYLAMDAQAEDVVNSIPAARAAVSQLGSRWVAVGHSQGGFTVPRVAELENEIKDPNYLGAVSLAPGTNLMANAEYIAQSSPNNIGLFAYVAYSITTIFPQFEFADMLTKRAAAKMPLQEEDYCLLPTIIVFAKLGTNGTLVSNWANNPYVQQFFATNQPYLLPAFGPILVAQGLADTTVEPSITTQAVRQMCSEGDIVEYKTYPGLDHDPLVYGSFRDQINWIHARFVGQPAQNNCP